MCGRFVRDSSIPEIADAFNVEEPPFDLPRSYNIAPSQEIAIILNDGKKIVSKCKWGFIPSWSKDPKIGYKMINARAETVAEKPSFRDAFKSKRALIPANGFYEWKREEKLRKPFYIFLKSGKPFGFAALYNTWISPEGKQVCTSTIITTDANQLLAPVHDRMPVIIYKEDEQLWLNPAATEKNVLVPLLRPYDSEEMNCHEVSALVNSPSRNSPDCIRPALQGEV
jgi:putative SOS response-associated peptidase YedK